MKCPYCKKEAQIKDAVKRNLESYGGSARARTDCCGKIIHVHPVISFTCHETVQVEEDDWGR